MQAAPASSLAWPFLRQDTRSFTGPIIGDDWSSSSPVWETKRYASPSLWQAPLMTGICRRRLTLIAISSTGLPVINAAGVLLIEYELNCSRHLLLELSMSRRDVGAWKREVYDFLCPKYTWTE